MKRKAKKKKKNLDKISCHGAACCDEEKVRYSDAPEAALHFGGCKAVLC